MSSADNTIIPKAASRVKPAAERGSPLGDAGDGGADHGESTKLPPENPDMAPVVTNLKGTNTKGSDDSARAKSVKQTVREAKLAAALRENLRRRKAENLRRCKAPVKPPPSDG